MSLGKERTSVFLIGGGPRSLTIKFSDLLEDYFKSTKDKFYDVQTYSLAEPALRIYKWDTKSLVNIVLLQSTMKILKDYNKYFGASVVYTKINSLFTIPNVVILLDWYFLDDYYYFTRLDMDIYRIKIDGANDIGIV